MTLPTLSRKTVKRSRGKGWTVDVGPETARLHSVLRFEITLSDQERARLGVLDSVLGNLGDTKNPSDVLRSDADRK